MTINNTLNETNNMLSHLYSNELLQNGSLIDHFDANIELHILYNRNAKGFVCEPDKNVYQWWLLSNTI